MANELSLIIFSEEMNLLILDGELKLTSTPKTIGEDEYLLEVFRKQGDKNDWPYIRTFQSSGEYQNRWIDSYCFRIRSKKQKQKVKKKRK